MPHDMLAILGTLMFLLFGTSCSDGAVERGVFVEDVSKLKNSKEVDRVRIRIEKVFTDRDALQLARAAEAGDLAKMEVLLKNGVDVNTRGLHGITPLWWSVATNNFESFSYLLEQGADPNLSGQEGWESAMHKAAGAADPRFVTTALKHGGDPNLVDEWMNITPLFSAVYADRGENVRILIEAGANVNHQQKGGATAAMIACSGQYAMLRYMIERGADPRIKDNLGQDVFSIIEEDKSGFPGRAQMLQWLKDWEQARDRAVI